MRVVMYGNFVQALDVMHGAFVQKWDVMHDRFVRRGGCDARIVRPNL